MGLGKMGNGSRFAICSAALFTITLLFSMSYGYGQSKQIKRLTVEALTVRAHEHEASTETEAPLPMDEMRLEHSLPQADRIIHKPSAVETNMRKSLPFANFYIPILEYHDVNFVLGNPYTMSPAQFNEEMSFLKKHGFQTISLDDVYNAIYLGQVLPKRPIVLTFDDGYTSSFTSATPILKKYGFKATEFMVSGFINKKGFLTKPQLQEMVESHIWQIGSHTLDHPNLTKQNPTQLRQQVSESRKDLSVEVHQSIDYFCYPFGAYDGNVLRAVAKAGYRLAVCTDNGYANPATDGPYLLNRIAVHQGLSIDTFSKLLARSLE